MSREAAKLAKKTIFYALPSGCKKRLAGLKVYSWASKRSGYVSLKRQLFKAGVVGCAFDVEGGCIEDADGVGVT